eukprot:gb/GECG01006804.1/.p1 GENE.gb/GECG01006804.1/~~gb/GECG01006804.1/.p1  ORF type:complete len:132 (+),score=22.82 gb/GECG01006804.1/:1-396(+)
MSASGFGSSTNRRETQTLEEQCVETAAQDLAHILHALYVEWSVLMEKYQGKQDAPSSSTYSREDCIMEKVLEQILSDTQVIAAISENFLNVLLLQWRMAKAESFTGRAEYSDHKQLSMTLLECLASLQKST